MTSPRSILVVEDEPEVRELVSLELQDAGFEVVEAERADQALALAAERPFDVLFTDIKLPGPLDGWELAERARSVHPGLRIIYASGYTDSVSRQLPGTMFLRKPYLPSDLIERIRAMSFE